MSRTCHRILSNRAGRPGVMLILCIASVACSGGMTDSGRHSRVVLDMRSLFGSVLGGDFVSVLDTARLTITSGGKEQTQTRLFGSGDSEVTFDVTVEPGSATFRLEVISNNGTRLYQGETTSTIDGDDFAVTITPQPVNAVMVVYPGRMTFTTTVNAQTQFLTDTLRVRNSGSTTMLWKMVAPTLGGGATVSCDVPVQDSSCLDNVTWTASTDEIIVVQFTAPLTSGFTLPASLTFLSTTVGNLTVPTAP